LFILANLVSALAHLLHWAIWVLQIVIIARVVLSWADANPYNPFVRAVGTVTEPILSPLRRLLPPWRMNGWDLSPVLALLALWFLDLFLVKSLFDIASRMQG
jgi:YggT family protein